MLESIIIETKESSSGSVLDVDIEDFITHLRGDGYAERTLRKKRSVVGAFARWSRRIKLAIAALSEVEMERFVARLPRKRKARRAFESAALRQFLQHLHRTARIASASAEDECASTLEVEQRYVDFLRKERGLADNSVRVYAPHIHNLLLALISKHGSVSLEKLNAEMVHSFLLERARERSSEWTRLMATALRSFFRFLFYRGEIAVDFSVYVPTVRKWRQSGLPVLLSPDEVERALAVPDRSTASGQRDYAILLLLARLALRAGEIVALELGDIRWRTAEIVIHSKGRRLDHLPLPADVGEAMAHYLRSGRGASASRGVFLRSHAPRVSLRGPAAVGHIVRKVLARAGIRRAARGAAHLFRHALASRMIQHGAAISEISEVLRHRSQSTTEIYAKVDICSLREVARHWPSTGGAQ